MGVFENTKELYESYRRPQGGLSPQEIEILQHLADAWSGFLALENKLPHDNAEFQLAIHSAQRAVAMRVARRVDTLVWGAAERDSHDDQKP